MRRSIPLLLAALVLWGCQTKTPQDFKEDKALYEYALKLFQDEDYAETIPFLESLRNRFPSSPYAVESELLIADAQYGKGDYLEAEMSYQSFRTLHPTHEKSPHVVYRLGLCHFKRIPGKGDRDQTETEKALSVFTELVTRWPDSPEARQAETEIAKCNRLLASRELYVANFYLKRKEFDSALVRLKALKRDTEAGELRTEVLYKLGYAHHRLNDREEAVANLSEAARGSPKSKYQQKAARLLAKLR
jgi:outer membrane protein assembly factor BamD